MGANLSASWLQSSKVQTEKRREGDGVRQDGGPCVWRRRDGVYGGGGGRKRQDRQGGDRMEAEVMDGNEMK